MKASPPLAAITSGTGPGIAGKGISKWSLTHNGIELTENTVDELNEDVFVG